MVTSLEMFSALEWTKNNLKASFETLIKNGALICQKYKLQIRKTLKNR